ncbi:MAG: glutaredoxin 3 [Pseudomonadota bacterium]
MKVEIYTSPFCPYCIMAKRLLGQKEVSFHEIDVTRTEGAKPEMIERAGGKRTVPQIFIEDRHIGGCDELYSLDRAGELDPLLAS